MQFIVAGRSLDPPPVPLPQAVAMFKATWEHFASGSDPRIKAIYPHADERAVTFVVEVESAEDLSSLLRRLPVFPLVSLEVHPVTTSPADRERVGRRPPSAERAAAVTLPRRRQRPTVRLDGVQPSG